MKAFVFPGQGAQFIGMGKDLYDNVPLAKDLFEKANDTASSCCADSGASSSPSSRPVLISF